MCSGPNRISDVYIKCNMLPQIEAAAVPPVLPKIAVGIPKTPDEVMLQAKEKPGTHVTYKKNIC